MALYGSLLGSASVWAEARLPLALPSGRHICGLAAGRFRLLWKGGGHSQRTCAARNYSTHLRVGMVVYTEIKCDYLI